MGILDTIMTADCTREMTRQQIKQEMMAMSSRSKIPAKIVYLHADSAASPETSVESANAFLTAQDCEWLLNA